MDHFYKSIAGAFTFPDFYAHLAQQLSRTTHSARVAEVGVYAGQSAAYLGVELLNRGVHDAQITLVDRFDQVSREAVVKNLAPIASVVGSVIQGDSAASANKFADGVFDAVFIDADHAYESVARDIDAWLPKVRSGGTLSGHDFMLEIPGVIRAVMERFDRVAVWRGSPLPAGAAMGAVGAYYPVWQVVVP
jgi:predicted O-methyltransferase YrrM